MGREMISKWLGALAVLLVLLSTTACETTQAGSGSALNTIGAGSAALQNTNMIQKGVLSVRPGDKIKVEFSGVGIEAAGLKTIDTEVKEDGTISLELIGLVKVAGKTLGDIEKEIKAAYVPKYFLNLNAVVTGPDKVYYVGGQVKQPGRQLYIGKVTVLQAIQTAGDFTDYADKTRVVLTRSGGERLVIDCKKAKRNPKLDVEVYPLDRVDVPQGL